MHVSVDDTWGMWQTKGKEGQNVHFCQWQNSEKFNFLKLQGKCTQSGSPEHSEDCHVHLSKSNDFTDFCQGTF